MEGLDVLEIHVDGVKRRAWPPDIKKAVDQFGEFGRRVPAPEREHALPVSGADVLAITIQKTPGGCLERCADE